MIMIQTLKYKSQLKIEQLVGCMRSLTVYYTDVVVSMSWDLFLTNQRALLSDTTKASKNTNILPLFGIFIPILSLVSIGKDY